MPGKATRRNGEPTLVKDQNQSELLTLEERREKASALLDHYVELSRTVDPQDNVRANNIALGCKIASEQLQKIEVEMDQQRFDEETQRAIEASTADPSSSPGIGDFELLKSVAARSRIGNTH